MTEQEKAQLEDRARRLIAHARTRILSGRRGGSPDQTLLFFSSLVMRLNVKAEWAVDTMATDGKHVFYNPHFTCGLSDDEVAGVLLHETFHCALLHFSRLEGRNHVKSNIAMDLAINWLLQKSGIVLPKCRLMPTEGRFKDLPGGMAWEWYYDRLPDDEDGGGGLIGNVMPAAGEAGGDSAAAEAGWKVAVAAAQSRGTLPADLERAVGDAVDPPLPWRAILREFVARQAKADYAWSRPNRRFVASGLYLPGLHSEELGEIVVAIDTSGSISADVLAAFSNELNAVLDAYPMTCHVVYADAAVNRVETWESQDLPVQLSPCGGGGTDHDPVFERVTQEGWEPACMICLTDGYTSVTVPEPPFPTLWALTEAGSHAGLPFGRFMHMGA